MRIIIKPAGLAVVVACIGALAGTAVVARRNAASPAAAAVAATAARESLIDTSLESMHLPERYARGVIARAEERPGGNEHALRFFLTQAPPNRWDAQASLPLGGATREGQPLTLRFWARSRTASRVAAVFEQKKAPYEKALHKEIVLTRHWSEYRFDFTARAHAAGEAAVRFQLGYGPGEIEMTGVRFEPRRAD